MEEKPNYYAIIPAYVRYDNELTDKAKLLYGEISALANKTGECWASNKYFAELYSCSVRTITTLLTSLKEKDYIEINHIYRINSKEIEKRIIKLKKEVWKNISIGIEKNFHRGMEENFEGGIEKNFQDNNTSINNTSINNNISLLEKKEDLFTNKTIDIFIKQAKEILNQRVYLLKEHREKILELNRAIDNFEEITPEVLRKLKDLKFDFGGRTTKPNLDWLLKDTNFLKVLNDELPQSNKVAPPEGCVNTPDEIWSLDEFIRQKEKEREERRKQ